MVVCDRLSLSPHAYAKIRKIRLIFAVRGVRAASDHHHHLSQRTNERSIFGGRGAMVRLGPWSPVAPRVAGAVGPGGPVALIGAQ